MSTKLISLEFPKRPLQFKYETIKDLSLALKFQESKRSKVKIADIRETLRLLCLELGDNISVFHDLGAYAEYLLEKKI